MMTALIAYKWSWLAAVLGGASLSLIGAISAGRNQSVQTLAVSQGAALGIILGLLLMSHEHGSDPESALSLLPTLSGLVVAAGVYASCELFVPRRWTARNTYFVGIFALLLAAKFIVTAMVPGLESHMAASFAGDIGVASNSEAIAIALLGLAALVVTIHKWRSIVRWSFQQVIFGNFLAQPFERKTELVFTTASLIMITASVQFLGLLFTLACLFLPVMFFNQTHLGLRGFAPKLLIASVVGVSLGLIASIWHGELPTSPTMTVTVALTSLLLALATRRR